jgi:hypothetical protein
MGDSVKKNDISTIGMWDSGLKYAMCICYRNNIKMTIKSGQYKYDLDSIEVGDIKKKTMLVIDQYDLEDNHIEQVVTGFSIEMGHTWLKWYAVRELYSNMKDEKGYMCTDSSEEILANEFDTVITLESDQLDEIYEHWNDYFLEQDCINEDIHDSVLIYDNIAEDQLFRIYKQNILIYTDKNIKSKFVYNVKCATIDERRVLNNYYQVKSAISSSICSTADIKIIKLFSELTKESVKGFAEEDFGYSQYSFSKEWIKHINDTQPQELIEGIRYELIQLNSIKLSSRIVTSGFGWNSSKVEVKTLDVLIEGNDVVQLVKDECENIHFELNYPLKESIIEDGYKALANTRDKIIYIDKDFTIEDMPDFIKAHYILSSGDENQIYKDYYELLKEIA